MFSFFWTLESNDMLRQGGGPLFLAFVRSGPLKWTFLAPRDGGVTLLLFHALGFPWKRQNGFPEGAFRGQAVSVPNGPPGVERKCPPGGVPF